ncbi:uncharacterized protein LOC107048030 [Diachasma alloeum]|uniref:uncharacterized protein LOC107048030 n=1 Tax=Diachasma alloeum TaxID=454923 RepID=UPI00073843E5|nr:uncharacterized protein LOC107048030 [Diachasma alloeum]
MTTGRGFLTALSIILVGSEAVGRTYQARAGYDLSNGPVTYEAYYPEDAPQVRQPLEKSYQTSYDSYPDSSDHHQQSPQDDITPWRHNPPPYVNQYRREQPPHTELEDALKMLIDAIRGERIARPAITELYIKEPSSNRKIDDDEVENIFKPRPQVINYVFGGGEGAGDSLSNRGVVQGEEVPQVAAIEVSEKPHKIRHHHGEKLRRNRVAEA